MSIYSEPELEQACFEWLQELGFETLYGPELSPEGEYPERSDYAQVVLEERLRDALSRINPHLPLEADRGGGAEDYCSPESQSSD